LSNLSIFFGRHKRLLGVIGFLALLWAVFQLTGLKDHWNLANLREQLQNNPRTGLLLFVLLFSVGNLVQIPGWIFLAAAVLALGHVVGGIVTYIAANMSCAFTFLLIRWVGGNALRTVRNTTLVRILTRLDAQPVRSIVLARMVFQTLPALNYALAMSGVKLRHYLVGTLLGLVLPIALYCLLFDYLAGWLHIK
jgi:uncharacterized membrane protein YdjX (TVP38/TMEM64 family)